jgi:uncharacterized protein YkwD
MRSILNNKTHLKHLNLSRLIRLLPVAVIFAVIFSLYSIPAAANSPTSIVPNSTSPILIRDLINCTNIQRKNNNLAELNLNSKLNNAAQAKVNDMVKRDYWAHTLPDGQQPWVFIASAGYQYKTAGENLAYGFDNGADITTGWMNSPAHRENMLNPKFTEVGFGSAYSPNFVGNNGQTVVVAMYAAPIEL